MCSDQAGTMLAINVFPYNNPNVDADQAGEEAQRTVEAISRCSQLHSSRSPGNDVVVSELGWPTMADQNGRAIASPETQMRAIGSMLSTVTAESYLFTAFDHSWQKDFAGSHNAETHFGLFKKENKWGELLSRMRTIRSRLTRHDGN